MQTTSEDSKHACRREGEIILWFTKFINTYIAKKRLLYLFIAFL